MGHPLANRERFDTLDLFLHSHSELAHDKAAYQREYFKAKR
jgi:hypothetical protein